MKRLLIVAALAAPAHAADPVPYPEGYRQWTHVKSMVIEPGHPLYGAFGGIHHLYANKAAMSGYRKGRFPDGAVIVFDLLEAKRADNAIQVLGVMRKERVVGANAASACFGCHQAQKGHDFVFSKYRP